MDETQCDAIKVHMSWFSELHLFVLAHGGSIVQLHIHLDIAL